ncbi:hypothetical protein Back11_28610 [Paenibacillus baekrokdamisoli]|uniref:Uncharacterized protein n=1 Tax=Paenibacillus baekrokdamisoli TaxID=1712516 RepID=A0A3G9IT05_9BACL|nr:hypothetical protein [Paenibacillus baekrokdamisoli]MBB3071098.1 hypothetical protein [Paenibacillus baekrokdamisoli]BBH21516.1 hypothetical protein Back11_28610 [Paenibacillus baekrokdamisoli]
MLPRSDRTIVIHHFGQEPFETSPEDMTALAQSVFPLADRVAGAVGEAFDFASWYGAWRSRHGIEESAAIPTHLKVEAADAFEALIPWEQLKDAAVQYAIDGEHLPMGPIRLYVPNGSSECLNVKHVVACHFIHEEAHRGEVSYGFKSSFSPDDLRKQR